MDSDSDGLRSRIEDDLEMTRMPLPSLLFLLGALFLASCASVSVQDAHEISNTPIKMPEKIYVQKFSMDGAKVEIDKQGKELEEYKQAVAICFTLDWWIGCLKLPLLKNTRVAPCRLRVG